MAKIFAKIIFFVVLGLFPGFVLAADLSFSSAVSSYKVGQTFTVNVIVDSAGKEINAVSGSVYFPPDKLEVVSLSKLSSLVSFWVSEPSFSNEAGKISFEGIVPNPGYLGNNGKIITITFKTKLPGLATLKFTSGSVLANDGLGTNVLGELGSFAIDITSASIESPKTTTPVSTTAVEQDKPASAASACVSLPKIEITSSTNKPETWASSRKGTLAWNLPKNVSAVQTSLSLKNDAPTGVSYIPPITEKNLVNIPEGTSYFNLRYQINGCWSDISRYKLMVDMVAPTDFQAKIVEVLENKEVSLALSATDALSGIGHYEIIVDNQATTSVSSQELVSGRYSLDDLPVGNHTLIIKAFDLAGNTSQEVSLTVNILFDNTIAIDEIGNQKTNEPFKITGKIGQNKVEAKLHLQKESGELESYDLKETDGGHFVWDGSLKVSGHYQAWVETVNQSGIKKVSNKVEFDVLSTWSNRVMDALYRKIGLIIPIIIIVILAIWYYRPRSRTPRRIKAENDKLCALMKSGFEEAISMLENTKTRRALTPEESYLLSNLKMEIVILDKMLSLWDR